MSSRLWGLLEVPEKIEFISYSDHYREKTLSVRFKRFILNNKQEFEYFFVFFVCSGDQKFLLQVRNWMYDM